jgi:hypothetical protein
MESVVLIAPREYEADFRERLQQLEVRISEADGRLVLEDGESRVYLGPNNYARDELDPAELETIEARIANPFFYSLDFSDIALCRLTLEAIADDAELLVDNDHGVLLSGADFVRRLRAERDWDWRSTPKR